MKNRTLQIANIIALIVTIIMNYLSNTGFFNESTMASVSAKYQNLFTPAGYAFSIWGLIYIQLLAFVIHQGKGLFTNSRAPSVVGKIGWLFVISCVANCSWILAWLYDYTAASVMIMAVLLVSLWRIAVQTRMELDLVTLKVVAFEWWPFATYLGWITVAIIANIAAYLTKIEWKGFGISPVAWTIVMIAIAVFIHFLLTWKRNLRESASVGAWGIVAVGVANWHGNQAIAYTAFTAAAILLVSAAIHGYRNNGNQFIMGGPKETRG